MGAVGSGYLRIEDQSTIQTRRAFLGPPERGISTNEGSVSVVGVGSRLNVLSRLEVNRSVLRIDAGGTVEVDDNTYVWKTSSISLTDAVFRTKSMRLQLNTSGFDFQSGRFETSNMYGDLTNQAGTFAPGYAPDRQSSIDIVNFDGHYTQLADATLDMELAGDDNTDPANPQFDQLFVTGDLDLAGTLNIRAKSGFAAAGQTLDVIHFDGALTGDFDRVISPTLAVSHSIESGIISVTVLGVLGDMDGSGQLDAFDIDNFELALADRGAYMAQTGLVPDFVGDMNRDGRFDAFDVEEFEVLLGTVGTTIPEPTSAGMTCVILIGTALRRRRGI